MKNKLRKSLAVFSLIMCMMLSCIPMQFYAVEINETEISEENLESEIPEDAILLSTEEDLLEFAENCRVDTWSVGKTVILQNDIELKSSKFQGIPTFGGLFLGQGNAIRGLYIEEEGSTMGFFRYLQESAIVYNLLLEGTINPAGSRCVVGGFVGENAGALINCSFKGTVSGLEQVGGIAGNNITTGVLQNCRVEGTVHGTHFVGGLVGENHGVIRNSTNHAEVNTKSVENMISIEDITMESLVTTEISNTATDIGGIAGISSGVIRSCINNGPVGYKNMGNNVGGIVGSQKGYVVDCINYADIQGRKEVGGIAGQMEPNIVLDYDTDSLQILSSKMNTLERSLDSIGNDLDTGSSELNTQLSGLETDLIQIKNAMNALNSDMSNELGDLGNLEDFENFEGFENWENDFSTAAQNDLSSALSSMYTRSQNINNSMNSTSQSVVSQMEGVVSQIDSVMSTVGNMDANLNLSIEDISGQDTVEDTLGKVANSMNYGTIKADYNAGGIAGVIAEENDLDEYEDTNITGEISLNAQYQTRAVIRGCKNLGTVDVNKQNAGGIVGQMAMGAVFESVNLGNIDALIADYVGGIAGRSSTIIRDSSSRAIISGDTYVGGIVGEGNEVTGCYAFVDIAAYTEKAGAIAGYTKELPNSEESAISENYYFIAGSDVGGIDGIIYTGATDKLELEEFLLVEGLDEAFQTVTVRFEVEGQNSVEIKVKPGESISMDKVPVLSTEYASEYMWEVVPAVASEVLGMGETATTEYLSEADLNTILFDQVYEAALDAKGTVVKSADKNENNLAVLLAEGVFARETILEMKDNLSKEAEVDGKAAIVNWNVTLSNTGVEHLHYLIPEDMDAEKVVLYVKDASGVWMEREFVIESSYIVFEFADGEIAFALVTDIWAVALDIVKIVVVAAVVIGAVVLVRKKKNKHISNN